MRAKPEANAPGLDELSARRRAGVRRTAWLLGAVAAAIFVAFILSGVFGR